MARKKSISILFITDDHKRPINLKLGLLWFKIIIGALVACIIIFIAGIFIYFRLVNIAVDYKSLETKYAQILKENNRIAIVMQKFAQIQEMDKQIRANLGMQLGIGENPRNTTETVDVSRPTQSSGNYPVQPQASFAAMESGPDVDVVPTILPVEGFVTRGFRISQSSVLEDHLGIDIVAREGSIITASGDGIVIFSNWTYESGNYLIIKHGNRYLTFYKHNKKNLVTERQIVHRGDPIALLGNSGISSGPHLHFEIWKDGKPVDPKSLIFNFK